MQLEAFKKNIDVQWNISGSKSESNRLLILKALFPEIEIINLSNSQDTQVLQEALQNENTKIDIHHAGTAMRFLTAYYAAFTKKELVVTGSKRMQERPIKILVEALRKIGAKIDYLSTAGYPPLQIKPAKLSSNQVVLPATISSQYISALLLIAPKLKNGLQLNLTGKITSLPYIQMTLKLLQNLGVKTSFKNNSIEVEPIENPLKKQFVVESDWSSASYFYSLAALSNSAKISLATFQKNSLQGDAKVAKIYAQLGVKTTFTENGILLEKDEDVSYPNIVQLDLTDTPDLAQTIAVTCLGLQIKCKLSGLHTLKIKETDRLSALKTELEKFGASVLINDSQLELRPSKTLATEVTVATYQDHRMAMAFAPLVLKTKLEIKNPEVVEKSFPDFWKAFESAKIKAVESK